jgi:hypothetical protein
VAHITRPAVGDTYAVGAEIHDNDNTYTWQDAQDVFIAQINGDAFGGHADWRLPTVKELCTLVDAGALLPAINTAYFPKTVSSVYPYYRSSTTYAFNTDYAYVVNFYGGHVTGLGKSDSYCVRAVLIGQ